MALDTQAKRMAAAGAGRPWMRATLPTGTIDAEERASVGNTYGGNPFVVVVIVWESQGTKILLEALHWGRSRFFLEAYHFAGTDPVYARLYNVTAGAAVSGSQLSSSSTTPVRQRSGALVLVRGKEYQAQTANSPLDLGRTVSVHLLGIESFADHPGGRVGFPKERRIVLLSTAGARGGLLPVTTVTADVTLTALHTVVLCDASSNVITVTLPAAASNPRRRYFIKKIDGTGNAVIVNANLSEVIDGALTQVLAARYDAVTIVADGTEWHIL